MKQLAKPLMIIVLFMLMTADTASAQVITEEQPRYRTGAGVRAGINPGFSVRHFLDEKVAVTGIIQASYKYSGRIFTLLYEWHGKIKESERLRWMTGGGFHTGLYRIGMMKDTFGYYHQMNVSTLGFDAIVGMEYMMKKLPLSVGADVKPYVDIVNSGFGNLDGAVTLRYVF